MYNLNDAQLQAITTGAEWLLDQHRAGKVDIGAIVWEDVAIDDAFSCVLAQAAGCVYGDAINQLVGDAALEDWSASHNYQSWTRGHGFVTVCDEGDDFSDETYEARGATYVEEWQRQLTAALAA
jgi:hypothetical protein